MKLIPFLLLIPVVFALLHYKTGKYPFSAAVTLSCLAAVCLWADVRITAAYALSVVGDWFMAHSGGKNGDRRLMGGILFFFLAHACFLSYSIYRMAYRPRLLWLIPAALQNVTGEIALELRSDMSCTLSLESGSMLPSLRQAVKELYSANLEANGSSTEDAEEAYGKSLDDIVAGLIETMDLTGLDDTQTGTYMLRDGNIAVRLDSGNAPGSWDSSTMSLTLPTYGELRFDHVSGEDTLAKGEGAMSYEAYAAAAPESPVVIEAYVQACQEWWEDSITVYAQDGAGGYFIYDMACSEKEAERLIPGQKIRVTGVKSVEGGEAEILDASFEILKGNYLFPAVDVTELLDREELIEHQNQYVSFKGLTIEPYDDSGAAFAYKDPDGMTDDLYFKASRDGRTYEFCVEFYLCGKETGVYKAVEALQAGNVVDLEGFLYWDEGANPHITSVTVK